ncbi:DUF1515 family protein [Ensifer sp. Root31]|uniref:DUF1515 family protein n=1 Tax=Ensifer sp. Root31 TaxID=1736512 RepID=UPI001FCD82B1|nr:DUF1515 family protein [Ensifer sp. Root31]
MQDTLRRIEEGADRAEDKAAESRAGVHRRMDELVGRVGHLQTSTATIVADVAEMKPVTDDVKRWKLMGRCARGSPVLRRWLSARVSPRQSGALFL